MNFVKKMFVKYREIIMYLIMGVGTTVVNWIVYAICLKTISCGDFVSEYVKLFTKLEIVPSSIDVFIGGLIAWIVAVIFAYITNKILVFESYSWKLSFVMRELSLFISARLLTGVVEIFGVPLLVALGLNQMIFGVEGALSKVIVSVFVIIFNYVFSKLLIFKDQTSTEESSSSDDAETEE